jgi:D-psicose/D-tagatose/L-ribulose 3-epimerase
MFSHECYALTTLDQASTLRRRVGHRNCLYMYDTFHANIEEQDPIAAFTAHAHDRRPSSHAVETRP